MDLENSSSEILYNDPERQSVFFDTGYKKYQDFSINCIIGSVTDDIQLKPLSSRDQVPPKPAPFLYKEKPKHVKSEEMIQEDDLVERVFGTGSTYIGEWKSHDMDGMCAYVFPNGAVFEGKFYLGVFDGLCTIQYPHGGCFQGFWFEGNLERWKYVFKDGLVYSSNEDWEYLKTPDRRFWTEIRRGLKPGGAEQLTNVEPTRPVPNGLYDVGDGFYNPKDLTVRQPDTGEFIRAPSAREIEWIVRNCRKGGQISVGFQKDLYKDWFGDDGRYQTRISDFSGVKWTRPTLDSHETRFCKLYRRNRRDAKHGNKYGTGIFDEEEEVKRDVQSMARKKSVIVKTDTDLAMVRRTWNKNIGGEVLMSEFEPYDEHLSSTDEETTLPIELSSRHMTSAKLIPSIDSLFIGPYEAKKGIRSPRFNC